MSAIIEGDNQTRLGLLLSWRKGRSLPLRLHLSSLIPQPFIDRCVALAKTGFKLLSMSAPCASHPIKMMSKLMDKGRKHCLSAKPDNATPVDVTSGVTFSGTTFVRLRDFWNGDVKPFGQHLCRQPLLIPIKEYLTVLRPAFFLPGVDFEIRHDSLLSQAESDCQRSLITYPILPKWIFRNPLNSGVVGWNRAAPPGNIDMQINLDTGTVGMGRDEMTSDINNHGRYSLIKKVFGAIEDGGGS